LELMQHYILFVKDLSKELIKFYYKDSYID
jgi:hypothetical protein